MGILEPFLLALRERREESLFRIARVKIIDRTEGPGQFCGLFLIFHHGFPGQLGIKVPVPLHIGVGDHRRGMLSDHDRPAADQVREGREPSALGIHAQIRVDDVHLPLRVDQQLQRMCAAVGVPDAVIDIEIGGVLMHAVVIGAEVPSILGDIDHPLMHAVERSIENALLLFRSAFHFNLAQRPVPDFLCARCRLIKITPGCFQLQIGRGLIHINIGKAGPHRKTGARAESQDQRVLLPPDLLRRFRERSGKAVRHLFPHFASRHQAVFIPDPAAGCSGKAKPCVSLPGIPEAVHGAVLGHGILGRHAAVLEKDTAPVAFHFLKVMIVRGSKRRIHACVRHHAAPIGREAIDHRRKIVVPDPLIVDRADLGHAVRQVHQRLCRAKEIGNRADIRIHIV